jgi:hypothetical protein
MCQSHFLLIAPIPKGCDTPFIPSGDPPQRLQKVPVHLAVRVGRHLACLDVVCYAEKECHIYGPNERLAASTFTARCTTAEARVIVGQAVVIAIADKRRSRMTVVDKSTPFAVN